MFPLVMPAAKRGKIRHDDHTYSYAQIHKRTHGVSFTLPLVAAALECRSTPLHMIVDVTAENSPFFFLLFLKRLA